MPTPTSRADAPPRRPAPPPQDAYEPLGMRVGTFLLKPAIEVTRGYDTNPSHVTERPVIGLHGGRADAEDAIGMVAP